MCIQAIQQKPDTKFSKTELTAITSFNKNKDIVKQKSWIKVILLLLLTRTHKSLGGFPKVYFLERKLSSGFM